MPRACASWRSPVLRTITFCAWLPSGTASAAQSATTTSRNGRAARTIRKSKPEVKGARFRFGNADYQEAHGISQQIVALYQRLPTTEIWNVESLNSTLWQIDFYCDAGFFETPNVAHTLYQKVGELIDGIEWQAELGLKCVVHQPPVPNAASYRLFVNEFILGDNTFLTELGGMRLTYVNHSVLHFVGTRDETFNDFMFANLQNLLKKSTLISGVSEKERNRFFNSLRQSIHQRLHDSRPAIHG